MRHYLTRAILSVMIFYVPFSAYAQPLCAPRRELIDNLKSQYGETEAWYGKLQNGSGIALLLTNPAKGSWTLLHVRPDVACLIGAGDSSTPAPAGDPA